MTDADIDRVLAGLAEKGVALWVEGGALRYMATQERLSRDELGMLRSGKERITAGLATGRHAPLTYAQRAYWNLFQLGSRPSLRPIASATRLRGELDAIALRRSVAEVVRRHDALHSRIVRRNGALVQEVGDPNGETWIQRKVDSRGTWPPEVAINDSLRAGILDPVDLAADPPLRAELLTFAERDHALVLTVDHIFSDMGSMSIIMRELWLGYEQASAGREIHLDAVKGHFAEYAMRQAARAPAWRRDRERHLADCLANCGLARFPQYRQSGPEGVTGWSSVPVALSQEVRCELAAFSRRYCTTPVMAALTAYVAAVLEWCGLSTAIIRYQSDGRFEPELIDVVGFLTSSLYLRIDAGGCCTMADLLRMTADEYCRAYENADCGYFEAMSPSPEFTRSPTFNWVPVPKGAMTAAGGCGLRREPISFEHPMLPGMAVDGEPLLLMHDTGEEVDGRLLFPANRFQRASICRFVETYLAMLESLMRTPSARLLRRGRGSGGTARIQ